MPFFKYTTEFPFIHECPESEAQFCDISQLNIERRKTVRSAVQHSNGAEPAEICPYCRSRRDVVTLVNNRYKCEHCGEVWSGKLRHC